MIQKVIGVDNELFTISESQLEGCWISENGNQIIDCKVVNHSLECTWPNQIVEHFQVCSEILKGVTNPEIFGYPMEDGLITWNTGNRWVKQGNC